MLTDQGLNIIAQSILDKFSKGEVGTDNTEPNTADTSLVSPITASLSAFTEKTVNSNLITLIYELKVDTANGNDIKEFGTFITQDSEDKLVSRFIHPAINKTDQIELVYRVEYLVNRS